MWEERKRVDLKRFLEFKVDPRKKLVNVSY